VINRVVDYLQVSRIHVLLVNTNTRINSTQYAFSNHCSPLEGSLLILKRDIVVPCWTTTLVDITSFYIDINW
jgi:hypothetical protein